MFDDRVRTWWLTAGTIVGMLLLTWRGAIRAAQVDGSDAGAWSTASIGVAHTAQQSDDEPGVAQAADTEGPSAQPPFDENEMTISS